MLDQERTGYGVPGSGRSTAPGTVRDMALNSGRFRIVMIYAWAKVGAGANSERMETNAGTVTNYMVSPVRLFYSQISIGTTGLIRS